MVLAIANEFFCFSCGCCFFIQKPIVPTELYRAVRDSQLIGLSGYSKEVLILNQKLTLFTAFTFFIL